LAPSPPTDSRRTQRDTHCAAGCLNFCMASPCDGASCDPIYCGWRSRRACVRDFQFGGPRVSTIILHVSANCWACSSVWYSFGGNSSLL
jgi:hypothetical protein